MPIRGLYGEHADRAKRPNDRATKKNNKKILSTVVLKYIELGKIGQQIYDLFADLIHINRVDIERSLPEDKKQPKKLNQYSFC